MDQHINPLAWYIIIIISLNSNVFSPGYCWKIAELALINNHSLNACYFQAVVISDFEVSLVITEVVTHIKPEDIFFFEAVVTVPIGVSDLNVFINTSLTSNSAVFDVLDLEVTSIGSNLNTSADPVITMASSFANFEVSTIVFFLILHLYIYMICVHKKSRRFQSSNKNL